MNKQLWIVYLALLLSACSPQNATFVTSAPSGGEALGLSSQPGNQTLFKIHAQSTFSWQNFPMPSVSVPFVVEFDAVPNGNGIDALTSLSSGPASSSNPGAVVLHFNSNGMIDASNGGSFASVTPVPYRANLGYHFEVDVNPQAKTFSAVVTPDGDIPQILAVNYAFQSSASSLDNLGVEANLGSHEIFQVSITVPINAGSSPAPAPAPAPVPAPAPAPAPAPVPALSTDTIVSVNSGLCMDVKGVSTSSGAAVLQWTCNGQPNQNWILKPMGNSQYELISQNSGMCLDDPGFAIANGTLLDQAGCNGGSDQLWTLKSMGNSSYEILSVNSGTCVDVAGLSKTAGVQLELWSCNGGTNQQWTFHVVGSQSTGPAPAPAPNPAPAPAPATGPAPTGAAFYVDPNGNDSNSGTSVSSPFQTLGRAQNAMQGSSIKTTYLRAGTYNRGSSLNLTSSDNGETWSYYPPDGVNTAVLDGGGNVDLIVITGSNITINGLKLQNVRSYAVGVPDAGTGTPQTDGVVIENCDMGFNQHPGTLGGFNPMIFMENSTNIQIKNNYVHDTVSQGIGLYAYYPGQSTNGGIISGNVVLRAVQQVSDGGAIYLNMNGGVFGSNVTVTNNFVRDYGASGVDGSSGIYLDDYTNHVTVTGNVVGPPTAGGVSTNHGSFAVEEHNGAGNRVFGNILDLGDSSRTYAVIWFRDGSSAMTGETFTGNIVLSGFSGNQNTNFASVAQGYTFLQNSGSSGDYTIQNNVYHNYAGGQERSDGAITSDGSPFHEDPQISGWLYSLAAGSPVFGSPVSFPQVAGGWGPPGFVIPQSGTSPSSPH